MLPPWLHGTAACLQERPQAPLLLRAHPGVVAAEEAPHRLGAGGGVRVKNCNGVEIDIDADGVYFVYAEALGLMKIGVSANIKRRLRQIQTTCPARLTVFQVCEGCAGVEHEFHLAFAHLRSHGEWFFATQEMLDRLRDMRPGGYFETGLWSGGRRPQKITFEEWQAGISAEGAAA
jgi:hypothetical protein